MRHWILGLLAWSALFLGGFAQTRGELSAEQSALHAKTFESASQAHQAGKYDESIAGFKQCLAILPEDDSAAYNIACGHALKQELDAAFEWLDKAVQWGFGASNLESDSFAIVAKTDADLDSLRADPRFAKVLDAMRASAKAVEDYADTPLFFVPERLKSATEVPVLVLLHERGSTKQALLASPWKTLAEELGVALVVPSARIPMSSEPEEGMSWFSSLPGYVAAATKYERNVNQAVDAFKKLHALDRSRVFLAGEGQGGMVAFNVAIGAPGLYKGVIVFDAPLPLSLAQSKAPNAAKLGLRGRVFLNTTHIFAAPAAVDLAHFIDAMTKSVAKLKLSAVTLSTYALEQPAAEQRVRLAREVLVEWLAPAPAAQPGAK